MKTSDILSRARELISDPERWTQGDFARDVSGNARFPDAGWLPEPTTT